MLKTLIKIYHIIVQFEDRPRVLQDLAEITVVEDAIFCHSARFIAVAKSLDGIKKMAQLAKKYI